ncbi:MAG: hypothetical protein J6I37_09895 [Prevotella sp.]|nr:hypothetical protein [Prevotella sp.]
MKKLSIFTFLALFATTLTHQGGAWAQDTKDTKDDNWGQVPTVTSKWTHITEGSDVGFELKDQYYYVTEDLTFTNTISGPGQGSGMYVQADRTVTLYIPAGVTLTVKGADAQGTTGAGAGILLPSGTTLNIIGNGTLKATGGNAADGEKGGNGTDAIFTPDEDGDEGEADEWAWLLGSKITAGRGGYGGYGGGGAGAGIGTAGGNGGEGAAMLSSEDDRVPSSRPDWEGGDLAGRAGDPGSAGSAAEATMGTLNIASTITQQISGGAKGNGGAAGYTGKGVYNGGNVTMDIEIQTINGIPIPIPTFDVSDLQSIAGGGGGGGGAGGGSAHAIGTGGAGGGGGASGACGSGCAKNGWMNDNWGSVGAGGGQGGYGPEDNNGAAGFTFWFQGDDSEFDDADNHKPGGEGGAAGTPVSADMASSVGVAVAPKYKVNYYTVGATLSKNEEEYEVGNGSQIALPTIESTDGKNYKWILSIYGNTLGATSSHCGGPNGYVYEPGTTVDLSNIYGDIEFCAIYIGCTIDCASTTEQWWNTSWAYLAGGKYAVVNLKNRKLYKDGYWNTLTLPFSLTAEKLATTCLAGADIRRFQNADWDSENKKLTINFSDSNEGKIDAGVPYIIRWADTGEVIEDPCFTNVEVTFTDQEYLDDDFEYNDYETESKGVRFQALLGPSQLQANNNMFVLGAKNNIYKVTKQMYVYATHAYFDCYSNSNISMAREITIDFGGNEQISTLIENVETDGLRQNTIEGIFNLNGQRLFAPRKGLNIINGKKVIIK